MTVLEWFLIVSNVISLLAIQWLLRDNNRLVHDNNRYIQRVREMQGDDT